MAIPPASRPGPLIEEPASVPARTVAFSGYTWQVKSSADVVGPGPNLFSDSTDNVWIDGLGRLHLGLARSQGRWYCAEVVNTESLGLGRYTFELDSPVDALDPNAVLGLFTWSDEPAYDNREIDIELSRWGNATDPTNGQYVVQPYDRTGNLRRFTQPALTPSTLSFDWRAGAVAFGGPTAWTCSGPDVPPPGSEHVRMNLWLFRGEPPLSGETVEVVDKRFRFASAVG